MVALDFVSQIIMALFKAPHIFEHAILKYQNVDIPSSNHDLFEAQSNWRVPNEIVQKVLVPFVQHRMIFVHHKDTDTGFYLTGDEEGRVRRVIKIPGFKETPREINPIKYFAFPDSQMQPLEGVGFSIEKDTTLSECARRFWITVFDQVFECKWKSHFSFIL